MGVPGPHMVGRRQEEGDGLVRPSVSMQGPGLWGLLTMLDSFGWALYVWRKNSEDVVRRVRPLL